MSEMRMFGLNILVLLVNIAFLLMRHPIKDNTLTWNSKDSETFRNKSSITVPGQENVVEELISVLKNKTENHELIFFLGGPGVGKSEMSNILKEIIFNKTKSEEPKRILHRSINYKYKKLNQERIFNEASFCDFKYLTNGGKIILNIDHITDIRNIIDNNEVITLAKYYHDEINYCLKLLNVDFVHIVIVNAATDEDLELFRNSEDYKKYLQDIVLILEENMIKHAPQVKCHTIVFQPLNFEQVLKTETYINATSLYESYKTFKKYDMPMLIMYENYMAKDFIPHGRKMIQYLENYQLKKSAYYEFSYLDD